MAFPVMSLAKGRVQKSKVRRRGDPEESRAALAFIENAVRLARGIIERLAFFTYIMFAAENDGDPAFQDIAEFLAFVGDVFRRGSAFRKLYEDRFQHIFLRVGNQPFPEHALRIFLEKFSACRGMCI